METGTSSVWFMRFELKKARKPMKKHICIQGKNKQKTKKKNKKKIGAANGITK